MKKSESEEHMSSNDNSPEQIVIEFLNASGQQIRLIDLGTEFLEANRIEQSRYNQPFRIGINKKISKAGNAFYEYSQNGVPLPDGFSTFIKIEGSIIPFGKVHPSQNGFPTKEGSIEIPIAGLVYKVTAYITQGRSPYYVKVIAHKKPDTVGNISKAQKSPRGGSVI